MFALAAGIIVLGAEAMLAIPERFGDGILVLRGCCADIAGGEEVGCSTKGKKERGFIGERTPRPK